MTLDSAQLLVMSVCEAVTVAFLVRSQVWKTLPFFCVWIASGFVSDSTLFYIIMWSPSVYPRFYWVSTIIDSVLQFSVLAELAWSVLKPVRNVLPRGALFFLVLLLAAAGLCVWPLAKMASLPNLSTVGVIFLHLQVTFAILRVVCFLVLASFSQLLSIGWRDRELQVATGLGFFSIVSLTVTVLHSHQIEGSVYHWLDEVVSFSYLGTLTYWVLSFAAKEQKRKEFSPKMQQFLLLMGGGARANRMALSDLPSESPRKRIK